MPGRDGRVLPLQALDLIALLVAALALAAPVPRPTADRFDEHAAWSRLVAQVRLGPRPAGSATSRKLAAQLKTAVPRGSYQLVPGGLRNVVGFVRGRDPSRYVVVAAHYDTKEIAGFVGANDGASGTAVLVQLARTIKPRTIRPSVVFLALDGEEVPAGIADSEGAFLQYGIRGAKVAAPIYRKAKAMILLDFVGNKGLRIPREANSDPALWERLRRAAARVGVEAVFPASTFGGVLDDHYPFLQQGVPSIDLIDFDFPCWHRLCDDLSAVSMRSLDAVGETMVELLRSM